MHIWNDTKKLCNPSAVYFDAEGTRFEGVPAGLFTEISDDLAPTPPDGFTVDEAFYRTEDWEATQRPYIVWTPKSAEQLRDIWNDKIDQQIDALERQYLMPRATREFMLTLFAAQAAAQHVDPMTNIGYAKVKQFDDQIAALRAGKQ